MPNWFDHKDAALRYVKGRMYFHPAALAHVARHIGCDRVARALDVCCGTGLSTLALKDMADEVVGLDAAGDMLAHAPRREGIRYVHAPAEAMPLPDAAFDLVTVACGLHWLDRARFLPEVRRVLRPGGWFAAYRQGFAGPAGDDAAAFSRWQDEVFERRYPYAGRNHAPIGDDEAACAGLVRNEEETYTHEATLSRDALVDYFASRSNINRVVDSGRERLADVADWLRGELAPFFPQGGRTFRFRGYIRYLQAPAP